MNADFLTVKSEQISHIDFIVMNPPFSNADKHILHAYEIAPEKVQKYYRHNSSRKKW